MTNERDEISQQFQMVQLELETKNSQLSQQIRDLTARFQIESASTAVHPIHFGEDNVFLGPASSFSRRMYTTWAQAI